MAAIWNEAMTTPPKPLVSACCNAETKMLRATHWPVISGPRCTKCQQPCAEKDMKDTTNPKTNLKSYDAWICISNNRLVGIALEHQRLGKMDIDYPDCSIRPVLLADAATEIVVKRELVEKITRHFIVERSRAHSPYYNWLKGVVAELEDALLAPQPSGKGAE